MQVKLFNQAGKETKALEVSSDIFGVKWNGALVKQVSDAESANRRQVIAHTKTREEVSGGGKKPWKQKGTGRARHGSIRSPLWKGGGVTFGPRNATIFRKSINKKMKRKALFTVLSAKLHDNECIFIDELTFASPKTKLVAAMLKNFPQLAGKSLLLVNPGDKVLAQAARNIARLSLLPATDLNTYDLLQKKYVLIPQAALKTIEKTFLKKK